MIAQEITDAITPDILYLQECVTNRNLPTLILLLPYDTAAPLLHIVRVLKQLQSLKDHPTAMLIPYIKAVNALFHELLTLLPFEPRLSDILKQTLMSNLMQSLLSATYTNFTTKYQVLQDAPYILQDI